MIQEDAGHARHLALEGTYNVRDVGGYVARDGRRTRWRTLLRADSLHRLNAADQQLLLQLGVRTVVDLRRQSELDAAPNVFASATLPAYVNHSLVDEPTPALAATQVRPRGLAEAYHLMLETRGASFAAIATLLAEPDGLPAVVHCTAGKDRTGLVIALLLGLAGVPNETIAEDYALTSTYLVGAYFDEARERAERSGIPWPQYQEQLVCPAPLMLNTLAWLDERWGGAGAYLADAGVPVAALEDLRNRLLEP